MSRLLKFLITLVVGCILFGVIIEMVGLERVLEAFFFFLSFKGLVIFLLSFGALYFGVLKWKFVLRKITGQTEFKGLIKIWFSAFTVTYILTPFAALGGEPVKAYLAKKNYNLDWKKSIASVVIERILDWTLFLILTILGIFSLISYITFSPGKFILFVSLLLIGLVALLVFFYTKALKKESVLEWLFKTLGIKEERFKNANNGNSNFVFEIEQETINFLSLGKLDFWKALGLTFIRHFFFFARVSVAVFFLTGSTNIIQALAIYGFSNLALLFPTPASLGGLEAASILSFKLLGLNIAGGTIFAMVTRGADLLISLIGAIFLIKFALKITGMKILNILDKIKN